MKRQSEKRLQRECSKCTQPCFIIQGLKGKPVWASADAVECRYLRLWTGVHFRYKVSTGSTNCSPRGSFCAPICSRHGEGKLGQMTQLLNYLKMHPVSRLPPSLHSTRENLYQKHSVEERYEDMSWLEHSYPTCPNITRRNKVEMSEMWLSMYQLYKLRPMSWF